MTLLPVHDGMAFLLYEESRVVPASSSAGLMSSESFPSLVISLLAVSFLYATNKLNTLRQDPASLSRGNPKIWGHILIPESVSGQESLMGLAKGHCTRMRAPNIIWELDSPKKGLLPFFGCAVQHQHCTSSCRLFLSFSVKIRYLFDLKFFAFC